MSKWIKICGITSVDAIDAAAAAGADAVGFVFHPASVRNLAPQRAARLAARVPPGLARVAVFLHPTQTEVDAACAAVAPDWVQGDAEDLVRLQLPESVRRLPVLRSGKDVPAVLPPRFLYESAASGSGRTANWPEAREMAARGELILGGGLNADNVAAAIRAVQPLGVDVSSGVEREPGRKDPRRIEAFIAAARAAWHHADTGGQA